MLDFVQKRKVRSVMYNKITLIILFIILIIVVHSTWSVYNKKEESERLKNLSANYKNELEQRDNQLKSEIERLNTDVGIEAEIRSKFSVAKDSENIVVIVDDLNQKNASTSSTNIFQKIWHFFGF